jgi:Zn-dependent peptidase ImmA (M78 family)
MPLTKKTMTEKRQSSWLSAIAEAAKEQRVQLPPFTGHEMGRVRTESTASGRFVTIKRRFVSATEAENDGVELTLWRTQDDLPLPVITFREPLHPNEKQIADVLSMLKRWLVDEATLDEARSAVGKRANVHVQEIAPARSETKEYWFSDDRAFGLVVRKDRWAFFSRGKSLTSWRARGDRTGSDHLPLDSLDRLCSWVVAQWPVVTYGSDCRPDRLRGYGVAASRAYEYAKLAHGPQNDDEILSWWSRHAIRAADPELPNVFLERQSDDLVVSWDASPTPLRFYNGPYGEEALQIPIALPALRRLVIDRLRSMSLQDTDRQQELAAISSDAAAGYRALAHYKEGVDEGWLARQGFSRKDAEDVAFSGTSRHPIVGLLRSSRGSSICIDDYESILKMLKPSDLKSFHRLREVAKGLSSPIDIREPWESGYQLAKLVRERLGKSPSEFVDIENEVGELEVEIQDIALPDTNILGVCVGTPAYVPLILLNRFCGDASGVSGRRVTLAHELCHLLFDRAGLRSLARFEGGAAADSDRLIEMRANAFAIELLVPMATLVDQSGAVLGDDRLNEISRAQAVSFFAVHRHAGNLRNRLLRQD